jgi:hypothetical protein
MSDMSGVDDTLRHVIGSPGFRDKRPVIKIIEEARANGLVRKSDNRNAVLQLATRHTLYFETFLSGRIFQARAMTSADVVPSDQDTGYIHSNTVWILFGDKASRCFEIEVSPVPSMNIWMIPTFDHKGRGYFQSGAKLVQEMGFPEGPFSFPTNAVVDALWYVLEQAVDHQSLLMYERPVSQLRLSFMDAIARGHQGNDIPDVRLAWWRGWSREIVMRAWAQARIAMDPLMVVRRKAA